MWNVNILTTLTQQRIQALVKGGMTFPAARQQAEAEVLAAFYIRDQPLPSVLNTYNGFGTFNLANGRDEDHILAAITSLFEYGGTGNSNGVVSNLITSFQSEIATNIGTIPSLYSGIFMDSYTANTLLNNAKGVNTVTISSNLNTKYTSLFNVNGTDISAWLDQDGDHVIGKFKFRAGGATKPQAAADTSYSFSPYSVGASDDGVTYYFGTYPNAINLNTNSSCQVELAGGVLNSSIIVHKGDSIVVTCTPALHEASSTYLLTGSSKTVIPVARYDFNPFSTYASPNTPLASMITARTNPTVTLLGNGKVLVTGGTVTGTTSGSTNLAELYDPKLNTWTYTSKSMNVKRVGHTATLLDNGKVLVVGGDAVGVTGTAELYDPVSDTWTALAKSTAINQFSPASSHIYHTATCLSPPPACGQVLVIGGINSIDSTGNASVELYDSSVGTNGIWYSSTAATPTLVITPAITVSGSRYHHTTTRLNDGTILIAGGFNGLGAISDAEILTLTPVAGAAPTGAWALAGTGLSIASYSHTATLLSDGTVLIVGGSAGGGAALSRVELYDPVASAFNKQSYTLSTARYNHIAISLADGTGSDTGNILIAGGDNASGTLTSAELCDNTNNSCLTNGGFPYGGSLTYARDQFGAVMLNSGPNSGKVLLVGGLGVTAVETFQ